MSEPINGLNLGMTPEVQPLHETRIGQAWHGSPQLTKLLADRYRPASLTLCVAPPALEGAAPIIKAHWTLIKRPPSAFVPQGRVELNCAQEGTPQLAALLSTGWTYVASQTAFIAIPGGIQPIVVVGVQREVVDG